MPMFNVRRTATLLCTLMALASPIASAQTASNKLPPIDARVYSCEYLFKQHDNKAVILILGDSGITRGSLEPAVGNMRLFSRSPANGLCYPSGSELAGVVGSAGSPWIRSANLLMEKNLRERMLLVPLLAERSDIQVWQPEEGPIYQRLIAAVNSLQAMQIPIDAVIWQHGQNNEPALKEPQLYVDTFNAVLRTLRNKGISAPVFVTPIGNCPGSNEGVIRAAHTQIIQSSPGVIVGPRLGTFGAEYFHPDGCALNQLGLERYAQAWSEILRQHLSNKKP